VLIRRRLALLSLFTATLVSACGGRSDGIMRSANDSFKTPVARQCLASLKSNSIRYSALPNQYSSNGCHTIDTVKLMDFGTEATNLGAMTCPLAANFAAWARYAVRPAAKQYLGSDVVRIETFGTYNCRNINGGRIGKLSQHAFGNAVDVSAFILKDGRRISLLEGWHGKPAEQEFLRHLRQSACKRFGTVLSPDYNGAHANHLHFDMAQSMKNGSSYCR
jgi:hypothetical protein